MLGAITLLSPWSPSRGGTSVQDSILAPKYWDMPFLTLALLISATRFR